MSENEEERKGMKMIEAVQAGLFIPLHCFNCFRDDLKLYSQSGGMYSGSMYCRKCATKALKEECF